METIIKVTEKMPIYTGVPPMIDYEVVSLPREIQSEELEIVESSPLQFSEYRFGIERASFQSMSLNMTCGEVLDPVEVGQVEYVELSASHHETEDSSIEFYFVDGDKEVPVLPCEDTMVRNEKIFFGLPTRFPVDAQHSYEIRESGVRIEAKLEDVLRATEGEYSITYKPLSGARYVPEGETLGLKVVIRKGNKAGEMPYLRQATIKAYQGGALWSDHLL